jgi:predicted ATP-grasp superfamily ATP-dependent carboligase
MKAKILIPEYFGQQVLSGIRSLASYGDICDLAWKLPKNFKYYKSRFLRNYYQITPSSIDDCKYIDDIKNLCQTNHYDIVLPFGNDSYYAFVKHGEQLNGLVKFLVPGVDAFSIAHDKGKTAAFCESIGIQVPKTFEIADDSDLTHVANQVRFPVVIKAKSGSGVKAGLRYANNKEEFRSKYYEIASQESATGSTNYRPIVQEYIPGFIHDACTLTVNGSIATILTQVRRVMYPIYGGVGAINYTTHDPQLTDLARKLMESLNWNGPAQVEFKYDPRDRTYKLIEINPKLWGTSALAIKAGVSFPHMIREILTGKKVIQQDYPAGIQYIFLFPQAVSAYMQIRKLIKREDWKPKYPFTKTYVDFELSDPLPDIYRFLRTLNNVFSSNIVDVNANLERNLLSLPGDPDEYISLHGGKN